MGGEGWDLLHETRNLLPEDTFNIADAKRADIGNTSAKYAEAFFQKLDFDSMTVAPYMGRDSIQPFLEFKDKVTIVLGLTSNEGSADFQTNSLYTPPVYEMVLKTVSTWANEDQLMFVVGATRSKMLEHIRSLIPRHFLLVPGVGAQGGSVEEVCTYGMNDRGGLLINSSRSILYASAEEDFASAAAREAKILQQAILPYFSRLDT
jgi:orotidine-5'-phosphate decarboxylase